MLRRAPPAPASPTSSSLEVAIPWGQRVLLLQGLLFRLRLVPRAGDRLLLLPTAGTICRPCKQGKMKYSVKFLTLQLESHCQSKRGRDRLPRAVGGESLAKALGYAHRCLRKIPRRCLQWKQCVVTWLAQIKFCTSHMD